ncbi:YdcF family protein [Bacillus sp. AK128]
MKKRLIYSLVLLLLLSLVAIKFIPIGEYLVVNENLKNVDVLIVLSGDNGRLDEAITLHQAGYAEYVLLSRANEKGTLLKKVYRELPKEKVLLENHATSTYTNAVYSKEIMLKHGFTSAIIVTSDYHTRRTKLTFDKVFKDNEVNLTYRAVESNYFKAEKWWGNLKSLQITVREYISIVGYQLKLYKWIDLNPGMALMR